MKKLLAIITLLVNISVMADTVKKVETYDDMVKKEEMARELERDSYETEVKAEEEAEAKRIKREDKRIELDREDKFIEVKDDAGYDKNNMDKIRERDHRAWDKLHDGFDQPNK